jgi:predicted DNA-binding transcriptional regulator AlpA
MHNPFDIIMEKLQVIEAAVLNKPAAQEATQPEIINSDELIKRLGLSRATLITYRKNKSIPFIKIGSSIRFNYPKVIEALEKRNGK